MVQNPKDHWWCLPSTTGNHSHYTQRGRSGPGMSAPAHGMETDPSERWLTSVPARSCSRASVASGRSLPGADPGRTFNRPPWGFQAWDRADDGRRHHDQHHHDDGDDRRCGHHQDRSATSRVEARLDRLGRDKRISNNPAAVSVMSACRWAAVGIVIVIFPRCASMTTTHGPSLP